MDPFTIFFLIIIISITITIYCIGITPSNTIWLNKNDHRHPIQFLNRYYLIGTNTKHSFAIIKVNNWSTFGGYNLSMVKSEIIYCTGVSPEAEESKRRLAITLSDIPTILFKSEIEKGWLTEMQEDEALLMQIN